jgi:hypothetical protein
MNRSEALSLEAQHDTGRDHWQEEKEKLTLRLAERILGGRDAVVLAELHELPIFPDADFQSKVGEILLATLRSYARQVIRREKPLVLQTRRRFDLDDEALRTQLRRLRDMLAERMVFDKNELLAGLAFGVRLQFDLITRPRAALENLVYHSGSERQKGDIIVILQGLSEKHQLIERIRSLVAEFPDGPVTKEAFSAFCHQAEREVYSARRLTSLMADLNEYQRFRANIGSPDDGQIDNQTVLRMLHERGLRELAESLLPELSRQQTWSIPEIERLLAKDKPSPMPKSSLGAAQSSLNLEAARKSGEFPRTEASPAKKSIRKAEPKIIYRESESDEQAVISHAKIEAQPPGPYPSLTQIIDEKNRRVFIRKIFQKDLDAYLAFIERLEAMQTWKEAKALLDREFQQRQVNQYSKEAVRLSDMVFRRYFAKR